MQGAPGSRAVGDPKQAWNHLVREPGDPTFVCRGESSRPYREAERHTPMVNGRGKSDSSEVPTKSPNNAEGPAAEAMEGRGLAKGNLPERNAFRTQGREDALSALERVRQAASRERKQQFTALFHHIYDVERLRAAFLAIKKDAAAGVDGETWEHYGENLEVNLQDLSHRLKRGAYRARPVRRVYIPKVGKPGELRPLGVPALEDKIVQRATVEVLNAIWEQDFLGFSYGFRPGRSPHQALDALAVGIGTRKVSWVLDADIQGFFDTISLEWLVKFLEHRIADQRLLRLIQKWLRAGVSEDGQWTKSEVGTPQGAVASPLLANVFLHYVFDLWVQQWRTKFATGEVIVVRYADDFLVGFQYRHEAGRFLRELRERFGKFGLALHPDKTRLIEFGRFAARDRQQRGQGKPETFDFLGFTHCCGRKRQSGGFHVRRKTVSKRLRAKLRGVKEALLRRRHEPLSQQIAWLQGVVRGYFNYHAIPGNMPALETFRREAIRSWLGALRRRSQRHRLTWQRFGSLADLCIPKPKILHRHPNERFYAKHPK